LSGGADSGIVLAAPGTRADRTATARHEEQATVNVDDREQRGFVPVPEVGAGLPDVEDAVQSGDLTTDEAARQLQQAARRRTAESGPDLDTDQEGLITTGGSGSGQGMEKQRTGQ
jgi:hypothetical protein